MWVKLAEHQKRTSKINSPVPVVARGDVGKCAAEEEFQMWS